MLTVLQGTQSVSICGEVFVGTPKILWYNASAQIQVIEDLQPATDLATTIAPRTDINHQVLDLGIFGWSLGSWLRWFHEWAQQPSQLELRQIIAANTSSRNLKWRTTFDTIVTIAEQFPTKSKADKGPEGGQTAGSA